MLLFTKGNLRQLLVAFSASLGVLCAGSGYMWVTPRLAWFTSPESEIPMTKFQSSWVLNVIEAGAFLTPIPTGILMDKVGRKPIMLCTPPIYILSWIAIYFTRSVTVLYVVRFFQGLPLGSMFAVLPIYLAEISSVEIRGILGVLISFMWYAGLVFTFIVGAFISYDGLAIVSIVVPLVSLGLFLWFPESPSYLIIKGRDEEALKNLMWLRGNSSKEAVTNEFDDIKKFNEEGKEGRSGWKDLLGTKAGRKALFLVLAALTTAMMGGLVTMLTYSSLTFADLRLESLSPNTYTIIMGLILLLLVPFSGIFLDSHGRRPVLLVSCFSCLICLLVAAVYSYIDKFTSIDVHNYSWISYVCIIAYMLAIASGIEATVPVLQGELFPKESRSLGSGIISLCLSATSLCSLVIFQNVLEYFPQAGMTINFLIFASFCLLGSLIVYFHLPETKGKTFIEIQKLL